MGTDIHIHIEVMHGNEWHHWSAPFLSRDYSAFAKLCGVRSDPETDIDTITKPNGFPDDATLLTAIAYAHDNHHDAGVATGAQLVEWMDWLEKRGGNPHMSGGHGAHNVFGYLLGNTYLPSATFDDVRMVYFFDN